MPASSAEIISSTRGRGRTIRGVHDPWADRAAGQTSHDFLIGPGGVRFEIESGQNVQMVVEDREDADDDREDSGKLFESIFGPLAAIGSPFAEEKCFWRVRHAAEGHRCRAGTHRHPLAQGRPGATRLRQVLPHDGGPRPTRTRRVWDAAARGEPVDWEALFRGYQATVDWPGCNFYEEFLRLYPEAKVILTVRDPERWYDSARQTIYYVRHALSRFGCCRSSPRLRGFRRMLDRLIWDGMFRGRFEDRAFAIEVFNRHIEEVKRVVPNDRLLVYEVKEGWGPLCRSSASRFRRTSPFPTSTTPRNSGHGFGKVNATFGSSPSPSWGPWFWS